MKKNNGEMVFIGELLIPIGPFSSKLATPRAASVVVNYTSKYISI
jgi:hypothetical protein